MELYERPSIAPFRARSSCSHLEAQGQRVICSQGWTRVEPGAFLSTAYPVREGSGNTCGTQRPLLFVWSREPKGMHSGVTLVPSHVHPPRL